jgi:hypothetical protein
LADDALTLDDSDFKGSSSNEPTPDRSDVGSQASLSESAGGTISRRKRLGKMFRSFSLGTSAERKKLTSRIRRNIFKNSSFSQESPRRGEDEDEDTDAPTLVEASSSSTPQVTVIEASVAAKGQTSETLTRSCLVPTWMN